MDKSETVNARYPITLAITIPASGSAATLWSLVSSAFGTLGKYDFEIRFWSILPRVAAGTDRVAFQYGHAADACNGHVAEGVASEHSTTDLSKTYVESLDGSTVAAVIEINVDGA